jgi:hypothetical protein
MFDFYEEESLKSILEGYADIDGDYLKIIVNNPPQWVINEVKELLDAYGFPKMVTN